MTEQPNDDDLREWDRICDLSKRIHVACVPLLIGMDNDTVVKAKAIDLAVTFIAMHELGAKAERAMNQYGISAVVAHAMLTAMRDTFQEHLDVIKNPSRN